MDANLGQYIGAGTKIGQINSEGSYKIEAKIDEHYIEWIAVETAKGAQRKVLNPGEAPRAEFALTDDDTLVAVYAYCNLHGLWKAEN